MKRPNSVSIILALSVAGLPHILSATPTDGMPHTTLTALDLAPTANTRIGVDETGRIIAIVTTDDGEMVQIGLATLDTDDNLIFGQAELIMDDGQLRMQMVKSGGTLMTGDKALKFDPRIVALSIQKIGLGDDMIDTLVVKFEGTGDNAQLIFGTTAEVGDGMDVVATKFDLAGKTFIVASTGDITLVTDVQKSGKTWIAGTIGHVDPEVLNGIAVVTASDLAAFGIGIASRSQPMPAGATTRHGPRDRVAA